MPPNGLALYKIALDPRDPRLASVVVPYSMAAPLYQTLEYNIRAIDYIESLTNDGSDALDHNVEAALDDRKLASSKESNGDGRIEIS